MSKYTDNNASRGIKLNPSAACVSEYFLKYRKKYAFTLAEVLITIGVIGVVAALTIPNLMTNVRASENAALFKKRSSQLQNALKRIGAEEEQTIYGNINSFFDYGTNAPKRRTWKLRLWRRGAAESAVVITNAIKISI